MSGEMFGCEVMLAFAGRTVHDRDLILFRPSPQTTAEAPPGAKMVDILDWLHNFSKLLSGLAQWSSVVAFIARARSQGEHTNPVSYFLRPCTIVLPRPLHTPDARGVPASHSVMSSLNAVEPSLHSEISALMQSPPGDLYGVIRDAANPVEPWFFIPHNSRRIAKSRTIPAQFPQTQSRKWFVINMRRCGEQAVLGWGARGPGFKSRRPDQIPQRLTDGRPLQGAVLESNWSPKWPPRCGPTFRANCQHVNSRRLSPPV
jgi:hypothetical protein